jgi:hypothetical protein
MQATPGEIKSFKSSAERIALIVAGTFGRAPRYAIRTKKSATQVVGISQRSSSPSSLLEMQSDENSDKENSSEGLVDRLTREALFQKIKERSDKPRVSLIKKRLLSKAKLALCHGGRKWRTDLICCSTPQSALISSPPACSKKIPPAYASRSGGSAVSLSVVR